MAAVGIDDIDASVTLQMGEGWLLHEQKQLVVFFRNALPSAHAKWIELKASPMRGSEQPIVRRMLRQNAIEE